MTAAERYDALQRENVLLRSRVISLENQVDNLRREVEVYKRNENLYKECQEKLTQALEGQSK